MATSPLKFEELRTLSDLLSRAQLSSTAGMQFGTDRDLYATLGYRQNLEPKHYRDRYRRGGVAARVVTAAPQATWHRDPVLVEDDDPEKSTPFEEAVFELQERLKMWTIMKRADVLAGLGRFSVVLIGAPGELETPLEKATAEQILYLAVYSEQDVDVDTTVEDPEDARFGWPETYKFRRVGRTKKVSSIATDRVVHWSRVIHIADGVLDEVYLGTPRMEQCWNYLDDLDKVVGGGAEAFWIRVNPGMQFDIDKDVEMTPDQLKDLKERAEEFYHGIKRMIRTRGVTINELAGSVSAFNAQVDSILTLIAATTGIPKRILMGSERGELASSQDRSNWADQIADRQEQYATPTCVRQTIDRFIDISVLPEPEEYSVKWQEEDILDEQEKADVTDKLSGVNRKAGETIITGAEIRDLYLGLDPLPESADMDDVDDVEDVLDINPEDDDDADGGDVPSEDGDESTDEE